MEKISFSAVLLAAGASTRLGQAKQLIKINGESLVRRMSNLLLELQPESLTVVTGHDSEAVEKELEGLPVKLIRNENWQQGMGSSIAAAAHECEEDTDGLLIALCDNWKINQQDLMSLLEAWTSDISCICTAQWLDKESHVYGSPALIPRNYIRELKKLSLNEGAKSVMAQNLSKVQFVKMPNAAADLDTPEDLEQIRKHFQRLVE